jgi:hypothetical protein
MARIVKLLVIAVLLYVAWTQGWPWLEKQLGSLGISRTQAGAPTVGGGPEGSCISMAERANDALAGGIGRFISPPFDTGAWMQFAGRVQLQIRDADSACGCPHEACVKASEALRELDALLMDMDGMVRGSAESFGNPATRQERIFDLLNEARQLL